MMRQYLSSLPLAVTVGVMLMVFFLIIDGERENQGVLLGASASFQDPIPRPTPYPLSFRIQFDSNITRPSTTNNKEDPLHSTLYYDWTIPAQRIDHPAGAYECVRFYNVTTHGCTLYFLAEGLYRVIEAEALTISSTIFQPCCLDLPGLGPPFPDWAQRANPTFNGLSKDAYSGYDAYEFVFDKGIDGMGLLKHTATSKDDIYDHYHTTKEVHDGTLENGIPLVFTFPSKAGGLQDYHFHPTSFVLGHPDRDFFILPSGCQNVRCHSAVKQEKEE